VADAKKPEVKKIDPFDVEALEKSLNDSATRVSTIWISFLIFSLYLLITAVTVEHRQLLLAEPVKLPILNIDLPLWGFFFLAPILFVIFHIYVLLQVLLLGRTAAAYNEAVDRVVRSPTSNAAMRQRLANTLFAQIFAGSPREREGWLGGLLTAMAWITLAISPLLILLVFQFAFLPYHSHLATWAHRLLIFVELAAAFLLWPLVLDARRDFGWRGLRQSILPLASCAVFAFLSLSLATFPGEPHVNLFTGQSFTSVHCKRWFQKRFDRIDLQFDRLVLPGVDVVDDDKLAKIVQHTSERKLEATEGERTRNFRGRDLNCSDLSSADLRRADLTGASLSGGKLDRATLEGASLGNVVLQYASLEATNLRGASLDEALIQGASFHRALVQGASFYNAQLDGASFVGAQLQGASFEFADARSVSFVGASLQGALLLLTRLQGAVFDLALLHGASFSYADFRGASFVGAQLQGANLTDSTMTTTDFTSAYVWRANGAACKNAMVSDPEFRAVIGFAPASNKNELVPATSEKIAILIESATAEIPIGSTKEAALSRMRTGLLDLKEEDNVKTDQTWKDCQAATKSLREFENEHGLLLRDLACEMRGTKAVTNSIIRNWITRFEKDSLLDDDYDNKDRKNLSAQLARGLLGKDGRHCAAAEGLDEITKQSLREAIAAAETPSAPAK
jgi:uncharacterized protein YjbI with pentapeptide repeats